MAKIKSINIALFPGFIIAGLALSVLCIMYFMHDTAPDPKTATDQEKIDFLASERFTKMSSNKKLDYLDQLMPDKNAPLMPLIYNNQIPTDQRSKLMKNILPVITPRIKERFDEYDKMNPEQQTAQLDLIIDGFMQRQTLPGQDISPQRMALAIQYMDPYLRARFREHIPDLVNRMSQRGIFPKNDLFDNLIKKKN